MKAFSQADSIYVHGARVHNLKNLSIRIPRDEITVITGLSGSGKSSLAFDTIYAEGQRRYIESMSLHARQFLEQLEKPDVDLIEGLSPAIAIEQKTSSRSSKSTVGTVTEIYDYLRLLFARIGIPICPTHQVPIQGQQLDQIVSFFDSIPEQTKLFIYGVFAHGEKGTFEKEFAGLRKRGFSRARVDGTEVSLSEVTKLSKNIQHTIEVAVDRFRHQSSGKKRLMEALDQAQQLGDGRIRVILEAEGGVPTERFFNTHASCPICFFSFPPLTPRLFSFNSPYGMCKQCSGIGSLDFFDPSLLIPTSSTSLWEVLGDITDILPPFVDRGARSLFKSANVPLNTPTSRFSVEFRKRLSAENGVPPSLLQLFETWYAQSSADEQSQLDPFRRSRPCPTCGGSRLGTEGSHVTVNGLKIHELTQKTVKDLIPFLNQWSFKSTRDIAVGQKVLKEVLARLQFLVDVGLNYLTLDRSTASLSGGEAQRVRLASQLGTNLSGVLYVLDEPSIGLHPKDHRNLLSAIRKLRDQGNTVLIVEHDEDTIRFADFVVDIGPMAGTDGGKIIYFGHPEGLNTAQGITSEYFLGKNLPVFLEIA